MNSTSYRFKPKKSAYDEGVLKAIDWMQEICLYYIEEHNRLKRELLEVLQSNMEKIESVTRTPKTQAMRDTIERALNYVKICRKFPKLENISHSFNFLSAAQKTCFFLVKSRQNVCCNGAINFL